jgi:nicotinamide-nucleotide adenylyltransferase
MTTALFIGRFQPFHLGHLSVVEKILNKHDNLIIGIGSSDNHDEPTNPFTYQLREKMIRSTLDDLKLNNVEILPIPDINDDERWAQYVVNLIPKFDVIYTGSPIVQDLFKTHGRFPLEAVEFEHDISATRVRELMDNGGNWQKLVPKMVAETLKDVSG